MWQSISSKLTCTVHWMIGLNVDSRSCQSYSPMQHATYTSNQKHTKENIAWSVSDVRTSIALYFLFVIKFSSSWSCDHWNHLILHQNTFSADCNTFYYTHLSYWWSLKILTLPPVSVADYLCMIYMKFWMFYLCRAFVFFSGSCFPFRLQYCTMIVMEIVLYFIRLSFLTHVFLLPGASYLVKCYFAKSFPISALLDTCIILTSVNE